MSLGTWIIVASAAVVVASVAALWLVARRRRRVLRTTRVCRGCQRFMPPDWTVCRFCGWRRPAIRPRLEVRSGPLAGQKIELAVGDTTLGSVAGNTVVIPDPGISRSHVSFTRDGERIVVFDLESTNGVFVNGRRARRRTLAPGDVVRVGHSEFVLLV